MSRRTTTTLPDLTEEALCAWLGSAAPGDSIVYYRGFLAIDSAPEGGAATLQRTRLLCVARRAMRLSQQGLVHLLQRREAAGDFTYLAFARPRALSSLGALGTLMAAAYPDDHAAPSDGGKQQRRRRSA